MPEKWIYQDSRENQLKEVGLDVSGIEARATAIFNDLSIRPNLRQRASAGKIAVAGSSPPLS